MSSITVLKQMKFQHELRSVHRVVAEHLSIASVICILAALIWISDRRGSAPQSTRESVTDARLNISSNDGNAYTITLTTLLKLTKRQEARVIDLRGEEEYHKGHIPGATNISIEHLVGTQILPDSLRGGATYVVYGERESGPVEQLAADRLGELGLSRPVVYSGGAEEWKACGLAMEKGE